MRLVLIPLAFTAAILVGFSPTAVAQATDSAQMRLDQQKERTLDARKNVADKHRQSVNNRQAVNASESELRQKRNEMQVQKHQLKEQQLMAKQSKQQEKAAQVQLNEEKGRMRDQKRLNREAKANELNP